MNPTDALRAVRWWLITGGKNARDESVPLETMLRIIAVALHEERGAKHAAMEGRQRQ